MLHWIKIQWLFGNNIQDIQHILELFRLQQQHEPVYWFLLHHKSPKINWGPFLITDTTKKLPCFFDFQLNLNSLYMQTETRKGALQNTRFTGCTVWCSTTRHQQRATQYTLYFSLPLLQLQRIGTNSAKVYSLLAYFSNIWFDITKSTFYSFHSK